jgi:glycosyltransferase involved in cell wall biosynthesis
VAERRRGLSVRPLVVDLGRDYRGGQHQAILLLQGLRARGHAPELLTLRDSLLADRAQSAGIRVHLVGKRWRQFGAALVIRHLLAQHDAGIVHANEPHALTAAWLARAHRHVPLVASRRVIFPLSRDAISLARYRVSARIVAVSECVATVIAASGFPRDRLTVIPDGVPITQVCSVAERVTARGSLGIAANIPLLGCVAALTPDKGQAVLIRALTLIRVQFPECQLLLVGKGPCRSDLDAVMREEGLEGAIHFKGAVEDLSHVFAAIDLFAFPAQTEALGSALLAAMAHGLPVVAAAHGGIPEVVDEGSNGLLVKELDPGALAAAIARLLANPAEARRLGEAARETISARFSADRMVDATLQLYEQLIASHGHS